MAECAAAGVPPHLFWDYTWREIHAVLDGAAIKARRDHKLAAFTAWQTANLTKAKRMPDLKQLLRKFDPVRAMNPDAIRRSVLGIAKALGAVVEHRPKRKG